LKAFTQKGVDADHCPLPWEDAEEMGRGARVLVVVVATLVLMQVGGWDTGGETDYTLLSRLPSKVTGRINAILLILFKLVRLS